MVTDTVTPPANLAALIQAVDAAESAIALVQAVRALAQAQHEAAVPTFIQVLGFNNPGAAVAAVDGLVALGPAAVPALLAQLDGYNYGARAWAIRALALIGDPRALGILLDTARGDFALSVRRAAAKGLGTLRWEAMAPAEVPAAQAEVLSVLTIAIADPEWVVRYAAIVGLAGLATALVDEAALLPTIRDCLMERSRRDTEVTVRARAQLALTHLA